MAKARSAARFGLRSKKVIVRQARLAQSIPETPLAASKCYRGVVVVNILLTACQYCHLSNISCPLDSKMKAIRLILIGLNRSAIEADQLGEISVAIILPVCLQIIVRQFQNGLCGQINSDALSFAFGIVLVPHRILRKDFVGNN